MIFWLVAAGVVAVLLAVSWWSSGRTRRRGVDSDGLRLARKKSQSEVGMRSGRMMP